MNSFFLFLLLSLLSIIQCNYSNNWAVLAAGSNEYWNYRHQSDVFHSYQILIKNGFNPSHIILFAYDDIAYHKENPFQGEIFNNPKGEDIYQGVIIDYKGQDVTPKNYLKVIKGDKDGMKGIGSGKVLESNENNNVFMYFSDHGSDQVIFFPKEHLLYSNDLIKAFEYMHDKKMYHSLVYYLEACHSGSMFESLPSNLNIYATTASNPFQKSFAYYCLDDAVIRGVYMETCLGDEYSIRWMEDTIAKSEIDSYKLNDQYKVVKNKTKQSIVMEYGDIDLGKKKSIKEFQFHNGLKNSNDNDIQLILNIKGIRMSSRNTKLQYLKTKAKTSNNIQDIYLYQNEIQKVARSKFIFELFKRELNIPEIRRFKTIDFTCLNFSIEIYKEKCGLDERDYEFMHLFTIACSEQINILHIYSIIKEICNYELNTLLNYENNHN